MARTHLMAMPVLQFFDNTGDELNGGTLTFYEAGTSTEKDTYADSAQAVTNPNPITLDSAGRPDNAGSPIQIWLEGSYKMVVKDSSGNTIRTEDNITAFKESSGFSAKTANYTIVAADYGKLIDVDATSGNLTITLTAAATLGSGFIVYVRKSDASANTVTIDGNGAETINGSTTLVLSNRYDGRMLICDGTNWQTIDSDLLFDATPQLGGNLDANGNDITNIGTLELPNSATPTVDAAGEVAIDTTVTEFSGGLKRWYGNEEMADVSMPVAEFTGQSDGDLITYNSSNAEFEMTSILPSANGGTGVSSTPAMWAYVTSTQTISTGTFTKVQLATEGLDTDGDFDNTTNYRFTPSQPGKYLFFGQSVYQPATDQMQMLTGIYKNGVATLYGGASASGTSQNSGCVQVILEMNGTTDYVELYTWQNSGVDRDLISSTVMVATWVGR